MQQRYPPSSAQTFSSYSNPRSSSNMHLFNPHSPSPPDSNQQHHSHNQHQQHLLSNSPPTTHGIAGASGAPIALSAHTSGPASAHNSFDTFDDIEWSWTPPSSMEQQTFASPSSQQQHSHQGASTSHPHEHESSHYGYNHYNPSSQNTSSNLYAGPGSPHSGGVYPGPAGTPSSSSDPTNGSYGQHSATGFSTSPSSLSALSSSLNPHSSATYAHHNHTASRSQQPSQQHQILSASLPVDIPDYHRLQNGPGGSSFPFPGTAASPPSISTNIHHHTNAHQHQHPSSYGVGVVGSPMSPGTADWPSPPSAGLSDGTAASSPPMGSVLGGAGLGTPSSARPIRRRPIRKSESDHSYGGFHHHPQYSHNRSMSGGSSNATTAVDGSTYMFMPSPSSPLVPTTTSPPSHPALLPSQTLLASSYIPTSPIVPSSGGPMNGYSGITSGMLAMNGGVGSGTGVIGLGLNGTSTNPNAHANPNAHVNGGRHKHSRSASSGGSSSSPAGALALLSTSPTSPPGSAVTGIVIQGPRPSRAFSTSSVHSAASHMMAPSNSGSRDTVKEEYGEFAVVDGLSDEDDGNGQKKRRKRDSRDGKEPLGSIVMKEKDAPKKSLLSPPKASPSTWQIYFTDQLQLYRSRHPDQKLNVAQAAKELAQEYKRMSSEEREPYKRRAQQAKAERERAVAAWAKTLTPADVKAENAFRAAQRKGGKSRKANMKDPNAPKKPLSAYFMFLQRIRASPEMVREVFGDEQGTTRQSVLAAAKWRSMSDEEKKPFLARAEQEKLMYEVARRQYEESFADPDDPDDPSSGTHPLSSSTGAYSYGQLIGGEGFTLSGLSGHFVGIEQLSLNDTFISSSSAGSSSTVSNGAHHHLGSLNGNGGSVTGQLSNISAFRVGNDIDEDDEVGGRPGTTKTEVSEEDMREAMEQSMLQNIR